MLVTLRVSNPFCNSSSALKNVWTLQAAKKSVSLVAANVDEKSAWLKEMKALIKKFQHQQVTGDKGNIVNMLTI
jgi:hypothetical protein